MGCRITKGVTEQCMVRLHLTLTQAQILLCAKIGYMYYCEYAHLFKKHMEHTCMSAIYYDQGSDVKVK